jgi:hypothetical protein
MALQGKGFMIWKIPSCEGGSPSRIASEAKAAGLTHVLIKIADGVTAYNVNKDTKVDLVPPVVQALKAHGIHSLGLALSVRRKPNRRSSNRNPARDRTRTVKVILSTPSMNLSTSGAGAARTFMTELRKGLPNKPVALCSYRFPTFHPQFPWNAFLRKVRLQYAAGILGAGS